MLELQFPTSKNDKPFNGEAFRMNFDNSAEDLVEERVDGEWKPLRVKVGEMEKEQFIKTFSIGDLITLDSRFYVKYIKVHKFGHFNFFGITPDGGIEVFSYEKKWRKYEMER